MEKTPSKELSVSEFVLSARDLVEQMFESLWVSGEVANFTRAASGHWYFVLRDSEAQLDCVMLARQNSLVKTPPAEGSAVRVFGRPTLYAPRGRFQMTVRFLQPAGAGRLYQLFLHNKHEWAKRGWFDEKRKRKPVFWPTQVGVISSTAGAALRDILRTLRTRMPSVPVIVYPAPAQGEGAAEKIAAAINAAGRRNECETLIVCRGGGGVEDLWSYNEKPVVEAIVNSPIPVITGIGHQIDETLADYAADLRCPTPTAAAVAAVPLRDELCRRVAEQSALLSGRAKRILDDCAQHLDWTTRALSRPKAALAKKAEGLRQHTAAFALAAWRSEGDFRRRLAAAAHLRRPNMESYECRWQAAHKHLHTEMARRLQKSQDNWQTAKQTLEALSPQRTLERGYAIVFNQKEAAVKDAVALKSGEELNIALAKGGARATVKTVSKETLIKS